MMTHHSSQENSQSQVQAYLQGTKHANTLNQPRKFKSMYISSPLDCGVLLEFKDCVQHFCSLGIPSSHQQQTDETQHWRLSLLMHIRVILKLKSGCVKLGQSRGYKVSVPSLLLSVVLRENRNKRFKRFLALEYSYSSP